MPVRLTVAMRAMAVDWSGAATGAHRRIVVAEAREGELVALRGGLDRASAVAFVVAERPAVAGFDFSFAFPAWFAESLGCATAFELWDRVATDGEAWLRACAAPFWGRPGKPRPEHPGPALRPDEAALGAKSTFQVGGAGSVGTGALRGIPFLPGLRAAGFAVWPWDAGRAPMALEIYPRAFTGPVVKSSPDARRARLEADPQVPRALLDAAAATEDAFDAALSALALAEHAAELVSLAAAPSLEGAIWRPGA